jgi:hypothetical protein
MSSERSREGIVVIRGYGLRFVGMGMSIPLTGYNAQKARSPMGD